MERLSWQLEEACERMADEDCSYSANGILEGLADAWKNHLRATQRG